MSGEYLEHVMDKVWKSAPPGLRVEVRVEDDQYVHIYVQGKQAGWVNPRAMTWQTGLTEMAELIARHLLLLAVDDQ